MPVSVLVMTMSVGAILPLGGVILLISHSIWSRVKTWYGSPGRMTVGLGLYNPLGDVIFKTIVAFSGWFLFCALLLLMVREWRHRWFGAALGRWL
jgi:hypothetical protein